jgi:hypothetical protein
MPATSKAKAPEAPAVPTANGKRDKRDPLPGTGPITDLEAIKASFADAPPAGAPRGRGAVSHWPQVIEMLKANPGKWVKVGTYGTNGNRPKPLKDAGIAMQTAVGEPIDGHRTWDLWASYPQA